VSASFAGLLDSAVVADGAIGTLLHSRGLEFVRAPLWPVERAAALEAAHGEYARAGARILLTSTLGATRSWLERLGAESRVVEINRAATEIARRAAGNAIVAGSLGPLAVDTRGAIEREAAIDEYAEQSIALAEAGVDVLVLETFFRIDLLEAAIAGARRAAPDLPFVLSMTFDRAERALDGSTPAALATLAEASGASAVGTNCCDGPETALAVVASLARATRLPLWAKPNAGLPREGRHPVDDATFAAMAGRLVDAGARVVGGCCGTTPATIRRVAEAVGARHRHRPR
jgi:5-methyltetrahydrofolate--homocysteine methyltransferase